MLTLQNKVALVTGGYSGIGLAICSLFLSLGAKVSVLDISKQKPKAFENLLNKYAGNIITTTGDVSNSKHINNFIEHSIQTFKQINIIVNNASDLYIDGIDFDPDKWRRSLDINLIGAAMLCRNALPYLKQQKNSCIVNLGSDSTKLTKPNFLTYSTCKSALTSLTMSLALDFSSYGIRVNMVSPGTTYTPNLIQFAIDNNYPQNIEFFNEHKDFGGRNLFNRIANSEEIASVVAFISSDLASFINGANIPVDAGATII